MAATQIAVREAKRQNAAYRPHAVKALAQVAEARRDIDMHATVMGVVKPLIDDDSDMLTISKISLTLSLFELVFNYLYCFMLQL